MQISSLPYNLPYSVKTRKKKKEHYGLIMSRLQMAEIT